MAPNKRLIDETPVLNQIGTSGAGAGANRGKASVAEGTVKPQQPSILKGLFKRGPRTGGDVDPTSFGKGDPSLKAFDPSAKEFYGEPGRLGKGVIEDLGLDSRQKPKKQGKLGSLLAGGTRRPPAEKEAGKLIDFSVTTDRAVAGRKLRGESTKKGGVTDVGAFRRTNTGKTLREEANAPGLFKSTKDIIAGNIKANKASAQARGARADLKSVNAQRKSLGDLFESISTTDPTNPILDTIKEKLVALEAPEKSERDYAGDILAIDPDMDRGTLKQLIAMLGG